VTPSRHDSVGRAQLLAPSQTRRLAGATVCVCVCVELCGQQRTLKFGPGLPVPPGCPSPLLQYIHSCPPQNQPLKMATWGQLQPEPEFGHSSSLVLVPWNEVPRGYAARKVYEVNWQTEHAYTAQCSMQLPVTVALAWAQAVGDRRAARACADVADRSSGGVHRTCGVDAAVDGGTRVCRWQRRRGGGHQSAASSAIADSSNSKTA
jgi:hypothetical protein